MTANTTESLVEAQSNERKILLVGASRGLGLGLAKLFAAEYWNVVATERGRRPSPELKAAATAAKGRIRIQQVDINEREQVQRLHLQLCREVFDIIFIVAGVHDDTTKPIHEVPVEEFARVFVSNAYSPLYFAETFFASLKPRGTLAIMTSRMGSLTLASGYTAGAWENYRASKAALNMLARCFRQRHSDGSTLLLVHPGWVKTDMGGDDAPVELATSVRGIYDVLSEWHGSGKEAYVDYEGSILPW